jgi:hypothetical protein
MSLTIVQARIERLADRPDLLPTVAAWIYNEWWTVGREEFCARLGWQVLDRGEDKIVMLKPAGDRKSSRGP